MLVLRSIMTRLGNIKILGYYRVERTNEKVKLKEFEARRNMHMYRDKVLQSQGQGRGGSTTGRRHSRQLLQ
jgi:hypothetical protein